MSDLHQANSIEMNYHDLYAFSICTRLVFELSAPVGDFLSRVSTFTQPPRSTPLTIWLIPLSLVNIGNSRHYGFRDFGSCVDSSPFIKYIDHIPIFNIPFKCIFRVHPEIIIFELFYLINIIKLRVYLCFGMGTY